MDTAKIPCPKCDALLIDRQECPVCGLTLHIHRRDDRYRPEVLYSQQVEKKLLEQLQLRCYV